MSTRTAYTPKVGDWVYVAGSRGNDIGEIVGHDDRYKFGMRVDMHTGLSKGSVICVPMSELTFIGTEMPEELN